MSTVPSGARMSAEALAAKRSYFREWREAHREELREYNRRYAAEHPLDPEKRSQYNRSYWEKRANAMREEKQ